MPSAVTRVCLVVNHFPLRSQTFIVRLVEALTADASLECRVVVMKGRHAFEDMVRPECAAAVDASLVDAPLAGSAGRGRGLRALGWVAGSMARAPLLTLRALNVFAFGRRALRLHVLRLAWTLRRLPPMDAIHGQFLWFAPDLAACRRIGVTGAARLFSSVRGADATDSSQTTDADLRRAHAGGVQLLPVSGSLAGVMQRRGYPPQLISVVPSGLPLAQFTFLPPGSRPESDPLRLLFVGRLTRKKGIDLALRCVGLMQQSAVACTLDVLGDGPEFAHARRLALDLGLAQSVVFHGAVAGAVVRDYLAQCHIVLVPSLSGPDGNLEGIPNVAKEAMAAGAIVVASTHSGLPELIEDGRTGFLFAEADLHAMQTALRRAIAARPDWDRIAADARRFVEQQHSVPAMTSALLMHYGAGTTAKQESR